MLRITGGRLKGRKLLVGSGKSVRPTLEKTRETVFGVLQSRYNLGLFEAYDLFAGSGALGFEAFSRGSDGSVFLEKDKRSCALIRENIKRLSLEAHCRVLFQDSVQWLQRQKWKGGPKLFLLDPPYETNLAQKTIHFLNLQSEQLIGSIIVVETGKTHRIFYPDNFLVFSQKQFGRTQLNFLEIQSTGER